MGLQERVKSRIGSIDKLPFREGELILIWSEGVIYNIGFERGLNEWGKYLKSRDYIAVSESLWFTEERPSEIDGFWIEAYPGIDTLSHVIAKVYKAGYFPVDMFILPENCWMDHYFAFKRGTQKIFLAKHLGDKIAGKFGAFQFHKEELYCKYKQLYGYVFSSFQR